MIFCAQFTTVRTLEKQNLLKQANKIINPPPPPFPPFCLGPHAIWPLTPPQSMRASGGKAGITLVRKASSALKPRWRKHLGQIDSTRRLNSPTWQVPTQRGGLVGREIEGARKASQVWQCLWVPRLGLVGREAEKPTPQPGAPFSFRNTQEGEGTWASGNHLSLRVH